MVTRTLQVGSLLKTAGGSRAWHATMCVFLHTHRIYHIYILYIMCMQENTHRSKAQSINVDCMGSAWLDSTACWIWRSKLRTPSCCHPQPCLQEAVELDGSARRAAAGVALFWIAF